MSRFTHGLSRIPGGRHTPEYTAWMNMRQRCENPNFNGYGLYGGRGIKVCDEWRDFSRFISDMGRRPTPGHSLDRIDNESDYRPDNCRWATRKQQQNNRRNTVMIDGVPLVEICRALGLSPVTVDGRIRRGWPKSRWLEQPR